jgi:hypothetical protein
MKVIKVKPWGKDQGDHVLISEPDFDPAVHELLDGAEKGSSEQKSMTAADIKAALDAKGITYKGNASKTDLQALLDGAEKG